MTSSQCAEDVAAERPIDWEAELARHERMLRAVAMARLRDSHAVDEVVQEVALAAVRQRAPINDPQRVQAWLYRLALRQSLMYLRRLGRRRRHHTEYAQYKSTIPSSSTETDPLGWLLSDERRSLVRAALATLPARDAEVLLLKYGEGYSYHQLAQLLDISHSAVETRLHRARNRLRDVLTAEKFHEVRG